MILALEMKWNILSETTPSNIWKKLESIYASKSLTNWLLLKIDLYTLVIVEEGAKLCNYLAKFNMLMGQMVNAGEKLEDKENALLLLRSLSNSYNLLVHTILMGKKILDLKDVIDVMLENDRWLESKSTDGNSET